tara:strand:- start:107495 stop:108496 length:1002 start_codon:yes stop_codon:yes gene_type:complete
VTQQTMAQNIRVIAEIELRASLELDVAIVDCIESAIATLATAAVVMPPVLSMHFAEVNGEVDIKTAYVPGLPSFAVKISSGFFGNATLGLASLSGMMALFSSRTGFVEAILLDNGFLTDLRTAAAGAVAARQLSRKNSSRVAILGTGLQARMQLEALRLVRPIDHAVIWGRSFDKACSLAKEMHEKTGIAIEAKANARDAVAGADIVVTTTPAQSPILLADWLEAGQHVTAMGSDAAIKNELEPQCLTRADLYVADRLSQVERLGELRSALATGTIGDTADIPELGQIIAGQVHGRRSERDITICDLTGMGIQDTAIAILARDRLERTERKSH